MERYKNISEIAEGKASIIYQDFLGNLEGTAERYLRDLEKERQRTHDLIE